jgi:broad specificity phosphatase PhoE
MPPKRIMFIRHAEKPGVGNNDRGVAADGEPDDESLTVRGWQRAGALIALFCAEPEMRPNTIFASGVGQDTKSRRPAETVTPLVGALKNIQPVAFNKTHVRDDSSASDG